MKASELIADAEHAAAEVLGPDQISYKAQHGFTLQNILLLAPLTPDDDTATVNRTLALAARHVDILLAWRL